MKIAVTGAAGMLGAVVAGHLRGAHQVLALTRQELDITLPNHVFATLERERPDWVINCAAYTDVDGCERDPDRAFRVNAHGPWHLAAACAQLDIGLVQVSTDYVFDGEKNEPYIESDAVRPLNRYGQSKLEGEQRVAALCRKYFIVRTAWLFGPKENNFIPWVLRAAGEKDCLELVDDQWGSPTYVADLAWGIGRLLESPLYGLYHLVNLGHCTRKELAQQAIRAAGLQTPLKGIPSRALPRPAHRPRFSALRNYALELRGEWNMLPYEQAVAEFVSALSKR